jgi:hypothetical protein
MNADPFVDVGAARMSTWLDAVRATYYAINAQTRASWRVAAQWWDELTALHSPTEHDREIYRKLAIHAWMMAADRKMRA